ncbi:hypothetical protein [Neisseria dumasiana]|uniref:Uncharacterized protein n=1 Tax=Neisseria dumasiana TaxID=1931275 RepID=A0ABX3WKY3_9NEIS|nr:hypothetical protein [Neisseria dumasiana]OSI32999.1 hypothetical protein BV913_09290 [Neisseria dumasiana]UOO84454.1 hypothetical protein LVJ88_00045 [Neisseria dumasiana]
MKFNLNNKVEYEQQLNYALHYKKSSFLAKLSFIVIILSAILAIFLPLELVKIIETKYANIFLFGLGSLIIFCILNTLIFARCPKCKKVQPAGYGGAEVGSGVGLSYTKGFTPFRKRCYYCGTYLSVKQLEKDKLKQLNDSEQE